MPTFVRCCVLITGLLVVTGVVAAEKGADAAMKTAVDALLTRLDEISHDSEMTTAKKSVVASEAMEKFNQKYKGLPLTIHLKIQDVVPSTQGDGDTVTANNPDLAGVQINTTKFQAKLTNTEVMSVTKESLLVVTGAVSGARQVQPHFRSDVLKPGGSLALPSRANAAWRICLDNISYHVDAAPVSGTAVRGAAATGGGSSPTERAKNERLRTVDDIKLFFLKGIFRGKSQSGTSGIGANGAGPASGPYSRPNSTYSSSNPSTAKTRHNRIYTAAEIIQKFGNPTSRTSSATSEQWSFKCKDGVVHVRFTEVGVAYARDSSAAKSETVKLEIKSVDSTSTPSGRL